MLVLMRGVTAFPDSGGKLPRLPIFSCWEADSELPGRTHPNGRRLLSRQNTRLLTRYAVGTVALVLATISAAATAASASQGAAAAPVDRIDMEVWKRPLREVAAQLAQQGSVDILIPAVAEGLEVSASLVDVDARGALQRLLAHRSYMLVERGAGRSGDHDRAVIEIVLFGAGARGGSTGVAPPIRFAANEDPSVDELVQSALAATSGTERAAALDAIAYRDPETRGPASRSEPVLSSALSDPDEEVRAQAITTLKDTADTIPFDALSQVAREDENAAIRIQALELLVERGEERALEPVRIALLDSEDAVRARAQELIEEWHLDAGATGAR